MAPAAQDKNKKHQQVFTKTGTEWNQQFAGVDSVAAEAFFTDYS